MTIYQLLLVALSTLALIFVPIGWLISSIISLNNQINKLSGTISGQNAIQLAYKEGVDEMKTNCSARRNAIWDKLEEHSGKITDNEIEIEKIKERIK